MFVKKSDLIVDLYNYVLQHSLHKPREFEKLSIQHSTLDSKFALRYEDIDSGVCGVILFLIDLYKSRKSQFYLDTLMESGNELITHCKENARSHFGFFKGRSGVCFTLMKLSELTDNEKYLNFAMEIMRGDSDDFIDSEFATNRLYDGRSGLLIVLLNMYCLRPEEWILDKMQHCLKNIVADFIPTRNGIVWNRNDYNIKPLISYLYGSSGLVFALAQYGNYFGNGLIIKLAEEIAGYEDHFITKRLSSWPDFSNKMTTAKELEDQRKRFSANEINFFPKPKLNYDFENGIAGMGLSRLASRDLGWKDISGKNLNSAIENLGHFTTDDMSIIKGITGVGETLLISAKYLDNPDVSKRFEMIAERVASNDFSTQDITLFTGVTGVAYFLLHSEDPKTAGSVLFPIINQNDFRMSAWPYERLKPDYVSCIFRSCFPYSALAAELSLPLVLSNINFYGFEKSGTTLAKFISERFLSTIENIPDRVKEILKDIFNLESSKLKLLSEAKSNSIHFIKRVHEFEKKTILLNMSDDELKSQTLIFKNETRTVKTRWNWANLDQPGANAVLITKEIISSPPGRFRIILYRERSVVAENLNTIGSLTKSIFKNHRKVCDALDDYVEAIEFRNESERVKIKSYAMANIKYFIRKSLLIQEN